MDSSAPSQQQEAGTATAAQDNVQLSAAVSAANDLLLSSLEAGEHPTSDASQLDAQIAAYRASITSITTQLGDKVPADAADAAQLSGSPHGRDQSRPAAAGNAEDATNTLVPGLGQEGVDFTVSAVHMALVALGYSMLWFRNRGMSLEGLWQC